jgi:hypothetical protein
VREIDAPSFNDGSPRQELALVLKKYDISEKELEKRVSQMHQKFRFNPDSESQSRFYAAKRLFDKDQRKGAKAILDVIRMFPATRGAELASEFVSTQRTGG